MWGGLTANELLPGDAANGLIRGVTANGLLPGVAGERIVGEPCNLCRKGSASGPSSYQHFGQEKTPYVCPTTSNYYSK